MMLVKLILMRWLYRLTGHLIAAIPLILIGHFVLGLSAEGMAVYGLVAVALSACDLAAIVYQELRK